MKYLTTIKTMLLLSLLVYGCSNNDSVSDETAPPLAISVFPVVDATKPIIFEAYNKSTGNITSTITVITGNNEVVITSTLSSNNYIKVGACYSTNSDPTVNDSKVDGVINREKTKFATKISNIDFSNNRKYYSRSYAITSEGNIVYGTSVTLNTKKVVSTNPKPSYISTRGAICNGKINVDLSFTLIDVREAGICWSLTNPFPTLTDKRMSSSVDYSKYINISSGFVDPELAPNTLCYYRAYIRTDYGIFYSSEVFSFRTLSIPPYNITIESIMPSSSYDSITKEYYYPVTIYTILDSSNNEVVQKVGVLVSDKPSVTVKRNPDAKWFIDEVFKYSNVSYNYLNALADSIILKGLPTKTTFYAKTYFITNSGNVHYSKEQTFRTN